MSKNYKVAQHLKLINYDLEFMEFYLTYAIEHMRIILDTINDDKEVEQINVNMMNLKKRTDELLKKDWDKIIEKYEKE